MNSADPDSDTCINEVKIKNIIRNVFEKALLKCNSADFIACALQEVAGGTEKSWQRVLQAVLMHKIPRKKFNVNLFASDNGVCLLVAVPEQSTVKIPDKCIVCYHHTGSLVDSFSTNKATVGIMLEVEGGSNLVILASHLPAYGPALLNLWNSRSNDATTLRDNSLGEVETQMQFDGMRVYQCPNVVWMGDFNYRGVDVSFDEVQEMYRTQKMPRGLQEKINKTDQLKQGMMCGNDRCIVNRFTEQPINFPPTYRLQVEGKEYREERFAWTDRVIYKFPPGSSKSKLYTSIPVPPPGVLESELVGAVSDHMPVIEVMDILLSKKSTRVHGACYCSVCGVSINP